MERSLGEILRQLERKRKYRLSWSSFGMTRTTSVSLAKAMTLVFLLCLVYLSLCSILDSSGTKLHFSDELLQTPQEEYHRSVIKDHYGHKNFHNISISNIHNRNSILNSIQPDSQQGRLKPSHVNRLTQIFHKSDKDGNGYLDKKEISNWINEKMIAHFSFAVKDNFDKYFAIDINPRNGLVSWDEYLVYFFKKQRIKGITEQDILKRSPAYVALPRDVKVELARLQLEWSEAASNNPNFLTIDEFLSFDHPEASPTKILSQVQDTFTTFDLDGDGTISKMELETTYREAEGVDEVYRKDKHLIDTDGNGQISRVELMRYMDPRNIHHSEKEADAILQVADSDKDGRLTLDEIMKNGANIIISKLYDVQKGLHY